jgi:5,5'-dehydrodivanillate O-demethylase oxygenase subunit
MTALACNWFPCHENGVSPVHFEWLYTNWTFAQAKLTEFSYAPRHLAVTKQGPVPGRNAARAV